MSQVSHTRTYLTPIIVKGHNEVSQISTLGPIDGLIAADDDACVEWACAMTSIVRSATVCQFYVEATVNRIIIYMERGTFSLG